MELLNMVRSFFLTFLIYFPPICYVSMVTFQYNAYLESGKKPKLVIRYLFHNALITFLFISLGFLDQTSLSFERKVLFSAFSSIGVIVYYAINIYNRIYHRTKEKEIL